MPNTLVHLGVQSVSTKALFRQADFKWIGVGCIIPDIPWIFQRIIIYSGIDIDRLDLVQYLSIQASLFFCLIFSCILALITPAFFRIFLVLALNSFFHLLLDATQIKWGNGVHFFAPFSWELTSFDLFWPEHKIAYGFTAVGFAALVYFGARDWKKRIKLAIKPSKYLAALLILVLYFVAPYWLSSGPNSANNHYVATLRNVDKRTGAYIELDRELYQKNSQTIEIFSGERIKVTGHQPSTDTLISLKGHFTDAKTIHITQLHIHSPMRDMSSILGLAGILLVWIASLFNKRIVFKNNDLHE